MDVVMANITKSLQFDKRDMFYVRKLLDQSKPLLLPFYRWEDCGPKRINNMSQVK